MHPVRLRVLQAFLGGRSLTTGDLIAKLSDVPPASLYRHVARLVDAGVLAVAAERRVRGSVERTYELRIQAAAVDADELAATSVDDHRQAFMTFVAGLLGDFDRYLDRGDVDFVRDGVSYSVAAAWLDDAEYAQLLRDIAALLKPRYELEPRPGRRRRILASVLLPAEERAPCAP